MAITIQQKVYDLIVYAQKISASTKKTRCITTTESCP